MNFIPEYPMGMPYLNNPNISNNIINKLNELENKIKKLENRISRLENENNNNLEPDNTLYML